MSGLISGALRGDLGYVTQLKDVRVMVRLTKLYEEGRMTHEQASLVKGWNTLRCREVVSLGR